MKILKLILSSIGLFILSTVLAAILGFVIMMVVGNDISGVAGPVAMLIVEILGIRLIIRRFQKKLSGRNNPPPSYPGNSGVVYSPPKSVTQKKARADQEGREALARIRSTIILLGLPNSGKTVFWNVALNKLQSQLLETKNIRLTFGIETNTINSSLLETLMDRENPRWPPQHDETIESDFEITGKQKIHIIDCPGKDFTEFSADLKNNLKNSGIIFLIIDSAQLYGKKINTNLRNTLDKFMDYLQSIDENILKNKEIGIVFTKSDIYSGEHINIDPEEELKKRYQNFYSILTAERFLPLYKFFYVSAVGTKVNDDGDIVPEWNDNDSTLEPFLWALNMKIQK
jgi:signal recognition particle receptor subunit beta